MISSWKVGGIDDSWWLTAFRKTGSNSHINQQTELPLCAFDLGPLART
jgi:hypothetical protein